MPRGLSKKPQIPVTHITMDLITVSDNARYCLPIEALQLPLHAYNAIKNYNVEFTGQLVQKTVDELLRTPNFALKGLSYVIDALAVRELKLNTVITDRPDNETEFTNILRGRSNEALAQDQARASKQDGAGTTLLGLEAIEAVERAFQTRKASAFQDAGAMLVEVAQKLGRRVIPIGDIKSLPDHLAIVEKAAREAQVQGWKDAAQIIHFLGTNFSNPDLQKHLGELSKRQDPKHQPTRREVDVA